MKDTTIEEPIELDIEFEDEEVKEEVNTLEIKPEPEKEVELEPELDSENKTEEEKFHFLPKITREIEELDEDIIQICPTLLWGKWRKKLRCKHVKKKQKAV